MAEPATGRRKSSAVKDKVISAELKVKYRELFGKSAVGPSCSKIEWLKMRIKEKKKERGKTGKNKGNTSLQNELRKVREKDVIIDGCSARKCSICHKSGHNKATCPQRNTSGGVDSTDEGDDEDEADATESEDDEDDEGNDDEARKKKKRRTCGKCGGTGHNARTCKSKGVKVKKRKSNEVINASTVPFITKEYAIQLMDKRFVGEYALNLMEERFAKMNERLDDIKKLEDAINKREDAINKREEAINKREEELKNNLEDLREEPGSPEF